MTAEQETLVFKHVNLGHEYVCISLIRTLPMSFNNHIYCNCQRREMKDASNNANRRDIANVESFILVY